MNTETPTQLIRPAKKSATKIAAKKASAKVAEKAAKKAAAAKTVTALSNGSARTVICCHGIGNKPVEKKLRSDWDRATFAAAATKAVATATVKGAPRVKAVARRRRVWE